MRNSRIYTCHLQNELHVPGICGFINYNTVSTVHLWGDLRQREQRNCPCAEGMHRQEHWEGVRLLPASASRAFPSCLPTRQQIPTTLTESGRGHTFISLSNARLLSVIRGGEEALLGIPLCPPPWAALVRVPWGSGGQAAGPGALGFCIRD